MVEYECTACGHVSELRYPVQPCAQCGAAPPEEVIELAALMKTSQADTQSAN